MVEAFRVEFDDTVGALDGHNGIDSEFGRLLNHPVHLFALEQGLAEDEAGSMAGRFLDCLENASGERPFGDLGDLCPVPVARPVAEEDNLAGGDAETIPQMDQQVAGN